MTEFRQSPQMPPPTNPLGCLGFPIFLCVIAFAMGIYLTTHWSDYTLLPHIVAIVLLVLATIVACILLLFLVILITAYRLARRLKNDAKNLVDTAQYMMNMNPNAPLHPHVDVTATEVPKAGDSFELGKALGAGEPPPSPDAADPDDPKPP